MASIDTVYRIVQKLSPVQRREILIDLKASGKRSGGKMHTYMVFHLICEHEIMDDESLRGHLPDTMQHVVLRHIKARLIEKVLDYLQRVSDLPEVKMLRIKANIIHLVGMGIFDDLMKLLEEARSYALQAKRAADAAELGFLLHSERVRTETPIPVEEPTEPEATHTVDTLPLAHAYELYHASQRIKDAGDRMEAARRIDSSQAMLEDCIFPLEMAIVLKARYNLQSVLRDYSGAMYSLKKLLHLFEIAPSATMILLGLQTPMLLRIIAIYALEVGNEQEFEEARGKLLEGVKLKGPQHEDYFVALCWVELDNALTKLSAKKAEKKLTQMLQELKDEGHLTHADLPPFLLRPLALSAYHAGDYETSASSAAKYLHRSSPEAFNALTFHLIRLISQVQLGDAHMVGLVAREAVASLRGFKMFGDCLRVFELLSKVTNGPSLQAGIQAVLKDQKIILAGFEKGGFAEWAHHAKLESWLQSLKAYPSKQQDHYHPPAP